MLDIKSVMLSRSTPTSLLAKVSWICCSISMKKSVSTAVVSVSTPSASACIGGREIGQSLRRDRHALDQRRQRGVQPVRGGGGIDRREIAGEPIQRRRQRAAGECVQFLPCGVQSGDDGIQVGRFINQCVGRVVHRLGQRHQPRLQRGEIAAARRGIAVQLVQHRGRRAQHVGIEAEDEAGEEAGHRRGRLRHTAGQIAHRGERDFQRRRNLAQEPVGDLADHALHDAVEAAGALHRLVHHRRRIEAGEVLQRLQLVLDGVEHANDLADQAGVRQRHDLRQRAERLGQRARQVGRVRRQLLYPLDQRAGLAEQVHRVGRRQSGAGVVRRAGDV